MDCIYAVKEYLGNYGGQTVGYYERQAITGVTTEFFPDGVAYIYYCVRPLSDGFYCEYEVSTTAGEMVALNRWSEYFENEYFAKAATLENAVEKVGRFKADVDCKVANQDVVDLIQKFIKLGETEVEKNGTTEN
jgi:hypothetical protein